MKELKFRTLNANEIECRVGNIAKEKDQYGKVVKDQYGNDKVKGFFLLLYKNARVDQCILDETVGQFNWQCKYYQVKNTMVCSVGIYNEERNEWLFKDNGGDDDYQAEQVKAELSDAFKRACFNWGIGRELYYSPKIWVENKGENNTNARYSVKVIEYNDKKRITNLVIINDKTKEVVFRYGDDTKVAQNGEKATKNPIPSEKPSVVEEKGSIDKNDLEIIRSYLSHYTRKESIDKFFAHIQKTYGANVVEDLTLSQGKEVRALFEGK